MFAQKNTTKSLAALSLGAALLLAGCAQSGESVAPDAAQQQPDATQAEMLNVIDPWAKAAQEGMSAAFGTLSNESDQPIDLESVTDEAHGTALELHEMDGDGTSMVMQQIDGPLVIPAGQSVELAPGGNHIMYMDLGDPLVPAEVSTLRLHFSDGSTKDVDFAIRNYDGANESYHGGDDEHSEHGGEGH